MSAFLAPVRTAKPAEAPPLDVEPLITTHRILETANPSHEGLAWLHADLFDSRLAVRFSALQAVSSLRDGRSFSYVARLLTSASEEVQCAAVRALSRIEHSGVAKLLLGLAKTTAREKVRMEALEALASATPVQPEAVILARQALNAPRAPPRRERRRFASFCGCRAPLPWRSSARTIGTRRWSRSWATPRRIPGWRPQPCLTSWLATPGYRPTPVARSPPLPRAWMLRSPRESSARPWETWTQRFAVPRTRGSARGPSRSPGFPGLRPAWPSLRR